MTRFPFPAAARRIGVALCVLALSSPAVAAWKADTDGGTPIAVGFAAQGSWLVTVKCIQGRFWTTFILRQPGAWNSAGKIVLSVDGAETPVTFDGAGEFGVIVYDAPGSGGMSRAFVASLTTGKALILDGTAAAKIPVARRTFPLTGTAKALRAVAAQCGGL